MTAEATDTLFASAEAMAAIAIQSNNTEEPKKKQEEEQEDPVVNFRYMCKICRKKFVSGRALGGHMRAHGPMALAASPEHNEKLAIEQEFQKKRSRVPVFEDNKSNKSIEEDQEDEEEEEFDINSNNPMYALRRNPKRSWRFSDRDYSFVLAADVHGSASKPINSSTFFRNSRICDVCGKEFSSWKALFGHMKCHSDRPWKTHQDDEDGDGNVEENWEYSQKSESQEEEEAATDSGSDAETEEPASEDCPNAISSRFDRWMKGKRSKRPRYAVPLQSNHAQQDQSLSEEEDMAICLVMLASGITNWDTERPQFQGGEDSGASGSRDMKVPSTEENASELQKYIIKKRPKTKKSDAYVDPPDNSESKKTRYECTTCNKIFHSYQALGGHRASHKKIKGCSLRVDVQEENDSLEEDITDEELITRSGYNFHKPSPKEQTKDSCREESDEAAIPLSSSKKSKVHECSICHRVFASGQALGGHKRCHWGSAGTSDTVSTISSIKETPVLQRPARVDLLDLNLPAPVDVGDCSPMEEATHLNNLGGNVLDFHRPLDAGVSRKISPPYFQSWLAEGYPKQGLLWYNNHTHLTQDDEADSVLGTKNGLGRGHASDLQNGAQPWLQL
eukprot:Gb_16414 [translate_table: standard]